MKRALQPRTARHSAFEVVILAGGLSTRMGMDKARLRLNGRSMLSLIRASAQPLGWRVRVLRHDSVRRCGPLGGILTALKTTRGEAVLFLACDMPLVSTVLIQRIWRSSGSAVYSVFTTQQNRVGFPILLPKSALSTVAAQVAREALSLHELATVLKPRKLRVSTKSNDLLNVNTPEDKTEAERLLRQRGTRGENRRRPLSRFR